MTSRLTPVDTNLRQAASCLMLAIGRFPTASTALNDSLPGFRADTLPEAFGGGDTTQPERFEEFAADWAAKDLRELEQAALQLYRQATIVGGIVARWSGGTRKGTADEGKTSAEDWCSNHLHAGFCEARHRGDLCRWCGDFKATEGVLPPASLLKERHGGRRITQDMVKAAIGTRSKRKNLKRAKARRRRKAA